MNVIVIDTEAFELLKKDLFDCVKSAMKKAIDEKSSSDSSDWISLKEAQKLLPFKSRTSWQKLRDQDIIKFSQFGRKIMYSRVSILQYLSKNEVG